MLTDRRLQTWGRRFEESRAATMSTWTTSQCCCAGETRVHDGDRASSTEATPAAGPRADYRLRLTLDQWTPDGAVSGEIADITRLRLWFRSDYGTVTALDGSAVPQT